MTPKRFRSLPYRFGALWTLVFAAPLAAVVGATGGATLAIVLGLCVAVHALFVMWRVGVVATTDGVRLRGYVRNHRLPWHEIDHFEIEEIRPNRAYAVLVSGTRVKVTGIGPSWILFHDHTMVLSVRKVAALNAIRSQVLSGETAPSASLPLCSARMGHHAWVVVDFGCDFCRDDQNRLYGHVTQIGSSEERGTILLRCPRCGALYENTAGGFDETRRLTVEQVRELFPGASRP